MHFAEKILWMFERVKSGDFLLNDALLSIKQFLDNDVMKKNNEYNQYYTTQEIPKIPKIFK